MQDPNQFLAVIKTGFLSTDFSMLLISLADNASSLVIYLLGAVELRLPAPLSMGVCP